MKRDFAEVSIEKNGVEESKVVDLPDVFEKLRGKEGEEATVSVLWGESGPYANPKVSVEISVNCKQNKRVIEHAAKLAHAEAKRIVKEIAQEYENEQTKQGG